jgi:hypothetical protein
MGIKSCMNVSMKCIIDTVRFPVESKESCLVRPIPVHRSVALRPHESPATFLSSRKTAIHPR